MTPPQISISWSSLRTHMECKRKSALVRAGRSHKARDMRVFFHGMVVDRLMRDWLEDPQRLPGQMVARVDAAIERVAKDAIESEDGVVRWRHANDRKELRAFCTELVTRLEPILDRLITPHEFHSALRFREHLTVPYLDGTPTQIRITGEMDLLVHTAAGEWIVWDLKGTADDSYWRKVLGQLVFYDLAVALRHGERTSRVGLIQPMCTEPVKEFVLGDEQRNQLLVHIAGMATDIWRDDQTCKESTAGCGWCEVRHACPRFDPADAFTLSASLRQEIT